jgi:hypothetical protein
MCNYTLRKIVLGVVAFFFPTIILADCSPKDSGCRLKQSQIQAMANSGVQPAQALSATPVTVDTKKDDAKKSVAPKVQPYEIPTPSDANSEDTNSPNQNLVTDTSSATQAQTSNQSTSDMFMNSQGSATTAITKTQQPIGIQYK